MIQQNTMTVDTTINFPDVENKIGLGLGMDLPWDQNSGFQSAGNLLSEDVSKFLDNYLHLFDCLFISYQPKNQNALNASEYESAYRNILNRASDLKFISLHHTLLNLASLEDQNKEVVADFTNDLIDLFGFSWINEDLGIWAINGKRVPYPMPPVLNDIGLECCVNNINEYQNLIKSPLLIEFPGFSSGTNAVLGEMDAFQYFGEVVNQTSTAATFDIGHILSYQWFKGKREDDLYEDLFDLPFDHCFEIHLSGCTIEDDLFLDHHHGVLLDEQMKLLEILLPQCPNLKLITYEDPRYDLKGQILKPATANFERLCDMVANWKSL